MGFLHEGHLSLVRKSKSQTNITVVSIFVNPTQFAPNEDLEKYPRDIEKDKSLLLNEGTEILFLPPAGEIYPADFQTFVNVEQITKQLEGESRPTHFQGVTTIVNILFNIVQPDFAFFGQKDAQQQAVIKQMVRDLKLPVNIVVCPIVRESDGLAMSSRNVYLSKTERADALVLSKALNVGNQLILQGEKDSSKILVELKLLFENIISARLDYIQIVDEETFVSSVQLISGRKYFILCACRIGKTRLIDNLLVLVP